MGEGDTVFKNFANILECALGKRTSKMSSPHESCQINMIIPSLFANSTDVTFNLQQLCEKRFFTTFSQF